MGRSGSRRHQAVARPSRAPSQRARPGDEQGPSPRRRRRAEHPTGGRARADGLEVCRQLRGWSQVPILVLSVREEEPDKVAALDLGADDYLTKPFGIDELMARVRALLRRANAQGGPRPVRFRADDLEIDLDSHRVTRSGVEVRLTKTEWALLAELCQHPGKLLTHHWLLERVWGPGYAGDVDVLRVFISQLRKKLEQDPGRPKRIATDPGIGYRWLLRPADDLGRLTL